MLLRVTLAEAHASLGHLRWSKSNKWSSCWCLLVHARSGPFALLIVRVICRELMPTCRTRVVLFKPRYEALAVKLMRAWHLNHMMVIRRGC